MHPAFSVIFFTTLAGAGQGLFLALYAAEWASRLGWLAMPDQRLFIWGAVIAAGLSIIGLLASFAHLGRPERAWRTATMWRTSWLSREVIALPAFIGLVLLYAAAHVWAPQYSFFVGAATAVVCVALFLCTGMIYACIKFLREWASALTPINFLLLGCASGGTLAAALAAVLAPQVAPFFAAGAIAFTIAGLVFRGASLVRNSQLKPKSTLQTAIGVKHPRIVQKSQGFMGGSFNTREFFHGRSAGFVRSVKWIFLLLAFVVPVLLLAAGLASPTTAATLFLAAIVVQYIGLLAERWFFFAQANHPQNLYYQTVA
ncbi:MAG: DmsC/YnfH family molybdoenzyme membrane anchor subunit [Burkholderiales bacterium]